MTKDLANKTFIVTGANTGIGKVTALELARRGAHVILACRSQAKTEVVIDEIKRVTGNDQVEFIALDLGDLTSVRACAGALLARDLPIHGLINNAGLAARGLTRDGFELTFGTNHLGHYLLTRLLLERIIQSGPARIVNVVEPLALPREADPVDRAPAADPHPDRDARVRGVEAGERAVHQGARPAARGHRGHDLRGPPRHGRDRRVAPAPPPAALAGHAVHDQRPRRAPRRRS